MLLLPFDRPVVLERVSYFIKTSLAVLNRDYVWLAAQTGIKRGSLSDYGLQKRLPSNETFAIISRALGTNYTSVEDMVNDSNLDWDWHP